MYSQKKLMLILMSALLAWAMCRGMKQMWETPHLDVQTFAGKTPASGESCAYDASYFTKMAHSYHLEDRFHYFTRTIVYQRSRGIERQSMTMIPQALLNREMITVDVTKQHDGDKIAGHCSEPLHVKVPHSGLPSTVDASNLAFGVSTSFERWKESCSEMVGDWQYWLTDGHGVSNGAKLVLLLHEASDRELHEAWTLLQRSGIDAIVDRSQIRDMSARYINLVPYLYRLEDARQRRWVILCDDDTFFPSMHGLIQRLNAFDTSEELYIGALSEDAEAIERHGSQAFGGAGVFLSPPMAKVITDSIESCASEEKMVKAGWQGDQLLRNCIYEHSGTRLVLLSDLWQLDIRGDAAGFYESGRKPLSLHHYRGDGWHKARPAQFSRIAYSCGEDCILQRFQTTDNHIISGHSIAYYPLGITFDTSQVERTFEPLWERDWNFDFAFGPQRPSLKESGRKVSWEILQSEVRSDGSVRQIYLRRKDKLRWEGPGSRSMGDFDSVIELIWVPSSADA